MLELKPTVKLKTSDIEASLYRRCKHIYFKVSKVYYFSWESDFLTISNANVITEYEIKCSRADYKKDFDKWHKHEILEKGYYTHKITGIDIKIKRPNKFYYVCPEGLIDKSEVPDYAGLIYVSEDTYKRAVVVKNAPTLCDNREINWKEFASKAIGAMINNRTQTLYIERTHKYLDSRLKEMGIDMHKILLEQWQQ